MRSNEYKSGNTVKLKKTLLWRQKHITGLMAYLLTLGGRESKIVKIVLALQNFKDSSDYWRLLFSPEQKACT